MVLKNANSGKEAPVVTINYSQQTRCVIPMLLGEIKGASVYYHGMLSGDKVTYENSPDVLKTFFLINGEISFSNGKRNDCFKERASYVADLSEKLEINCLSNAQFIEIQWMLSDNDKRFIKDNKVELPMTQLYYDCEQYRETFKSPKSISRSVIGHHALPRFCMGSNESYGPDRVEPHAHPLLDQFFFSFPDNEVSLLIDDQIQHYPGNTLIHIPLGSNHGVQIEAGKKMNYMWIDFIIDPKGVDYLDEVHQPTGVKEYFNGANQITK
jgi:hypothetical protein